MKKLLAEMRHYDGTLVTSGDVYITIVKITDISNPETVVDTTTTGVYHTGFGVWGYDNPYEDPKDDVYLVAFEFTETPPGEDEFTYTVTGALGDIDYDGNWSIIAAGGVKAGEIRKHSDTHIDIDLNNGRKLKLRKR